MLVNHTVITQAIGSLQKFSNNFMGSDDCSFMKDLANADDYIATVMAIRLMFNNSNKELAAKILIIEKKWPLH